MHGRVKVRTSEEQAEAKRKEQQEKLKIYSAVTSKIFEKRKNGDLDEEALELTARLLEKNPEFYTWWNYRREILMKLKSEKNEEELKNLCLIEMDLTQNCLKVSPKSYSTWHHRYWTMEFNPAADWKRELKLCNYFLSQDDRNFHCWDYRRLLCKKCEVSAEEELDYSIELVENNFSNYSAWHYRSKLLPTVHGDQHSGSIKEEVLLKELDLVQNAAFTDPDDQSVWFYHRWLLGRSNESLHLMNVSFFKPQNYVAILLSKPYKVDSSCLELKVNDNVINVEWKSVSALWPVPTVWLCDLPKEFSSDGASEITATITTAEGSSSLSCCINGNKSSMWKNATRADIFRSNVSAATKQVLEQELESCQQLNELEPNCKWTMFTSVLLMRALNDKKFEIPTNDFMKQLMVVDFKRENYYKDLRSKFVIEDVIENLPVDSLKINLSNRNLTCLRHFDHFLLIEHIDLSANHLTSSVALCHLVCVKTIIIDDNELTSLEGLVELRNLVTLSAERNSITNLKAVEELKSCFALQELSLVGNPVVDNPDYASTIKTLPSLKTNNS